MSLVHRPSGHLPPPAVDLPSEVEVVTRLAAAVMPDVGIDWDGFRRDNDRTRDVIERVIPGFEDFNERVREPGGFVLPNPPRDTRSFATPSGRARFSINHPDVTAVPPGSLLLQIGRASGRARVCQYG